MSSPIKTSSTNTLPAQPDVFSKLEVERSTPTDESVASLEKKLQKEIDRNREERFFWICATTFLIDVIAFKFIESWPTHILLALIQLPVLVAIASHLGFEQVAVLWERLYSKYLKGDD